MRNILFIIHPGSACGSADFNLGDETADWAREALIDDVSGWTSGGVVVVYGHFSDELASRRYVDLRSALDSAIIEARSRGDVADRVFGYDDGSPSTREALASVCHRLSLTPDSCDIAVTGAWYDPSNRSGCVNDACQFFRDRGFQARILPGAMDLDAKPCADDVDLDDVVSNDGDLVATGGM